MCLAMRMVMCVWGQGGQRCHDNPEAELEGEVGLQRGGGVCGCVRAITYLCMAVRTRVGAAHACSCLCPPPLKDRFSSYTHARPRPCCSLRRRRRQRARRRRRAARRPAARRRRRTNSGRSASGASATRTRSCRRRWRAWWPRWVVCCAYVCVCVIVLCVVHVCVRLLYVCVFGGKSGWARHGHAAAGGGGERGWPGWVAAGICIWRARSAVVFATRGCKASRGEQGRGAGGSGGGGGVERSPTHHQDRGRPDRSALRPAPR